MGKEGVGLTYRGYSIDDLAEHATFEETAYLLIHGTDCRHKPNLIATRQKLMELRGLPNGLKIVLEQVPGDAHPMDVLRTGCSALGTMESEDNESDPLPHCGPADRLFRFNATLLAPFPHKRQTD